MKTRKLVLVGLSVLLPQLALADTDGNFRYGGDALAQKVCKAIVQDDVKKLKRLLLSYRSTRVWSYQLKTREQMSRDFSCNEMDLDQFSSYMGSPHVSAYFYGENDLRQTAATTK